MMSLFEFSKDMIKIPLQNWNMKTFPDHGWRFGKPKGFYITISHTYGTEDKTREIDIKPKMKEYRTVSWQSSQKLRAIIGGI